MLKENNLSSFMEGIKLRYLLLIFFSMIILNGCFNETKLTENEKKTREIKVGNKEHDKIIGSTLILLENGKNLKVKAYSNSKFLLISGKPLNEEIARGGPFVMNTKKEILNAVNDYHNGTFVK